MLLIPDIVRIERAWMEQSAAFGRVLSQLDPIWGSEVFDWVDGVAVLCGPGLYVNQAMAVGLNAELTDDHLAMLAARSASVGVRPAVDTSDASLPGTVELLLARGYEPDDAVTALVHDLHGLPDGMTEHSIVVDQVDATSIATWKQTSALGWGHESAERRRASDAFVDAAGVVDTPGLILARSAHDGHALGCASLHIQDGVAILGGMSTIPAERGAGVQSTLIRHRLEVARDLGCDLAVTSPTRGSGSDRNLHRAGFTPAYTKVTYRHI